MEPSTLDYTEQMIFSKALKTNHKVLVHYTGLL